MSNLTMDQQTILGNKNQTFIAWNWFDQTNVWFNMLSYLNNKMVCVVEIQGADSIKLKTPRGQ